MAGPCDVKEKKGKPQKKLALGGQQHSEDQGRALKAGRAATEKRG